MGTVAPLQMSQMKEHKYQITVCGLLLLIILGVGSFYRLNELDKMAYHHDESLHCFYSYKLYEVGPWSGRLGKGSPPYYDAVYHGPFNYHLGALFFFLFGDSDFTGRLSYSVYGILMLLIAYGIWIVTDKRTGLLAAFFCAISPVLVYFSRFARNDVLLGTDNLAMFIFAVWYFKTGKVRYFYLTALATIFAYTTKESSYVAGAILCSFLVAYCIYRIVVDLYHGRRDMLEKVFSTYSVFTFVVLLYGIFSVAMVTYVYWDVHETVFFGTSFHDSGGFRTIYWVITFIFMAITYAAIFLARRSMLRKKYFEPLHEAGEEDIRTARRAISYQIFKDVGLLAGILGTILFVYSLLFTVLFTASAEMWDGIYRYLEYWMRAHNNPRIPGPSTYHIVRLLFYEPMAVVLCLAAGVYYPYRAIMWFVSTVGFKNSSERKARMQAAYPIPSWVPFLFIYWSLFSIWIYSVLQEKVQWLLYHQAMPMLMLSAIFVGEVYGRLKPGVVRKCFVALLLLMVSYQIRAATLATFDRPDDPKNMLVYTQSSPDVPKVADEIYEYAEMLEARGERAIIQMSGETPWPYSWYLRHYQTASGVVAGQNYPIVMTDVKDKMRMKTVLENKFVGRQYRLRVWWQPNDFRQVFDGQDWWEKFWRYFFYREPWRNPYIGSSDFMFYVRRDLFLNLPPGVDLDEKKVPDMQAVNPAISQPSELSLVKSWGEPGDGQGQMTYPRGIAAAPNGDIYVADSRNHRIQVFDREGAFKDSWGGQGNEPGQLNEPAGIALDSAGNLFVADLWNHRAQKFSSTGQFLAVLQPTAGAFFGPRDLAVNPIDHSVFIADTGNKRVQVFSNTGRFMGEWGSQGTRSGKFEEPIGVAVGPDGRIYVADTGNKRIQIFNNEKDHKCLALWKVPGWQSTSAEPYLALDSAGRLYATDALSQRILRFSPDGTRVAVFTYGSGRQARGLTRPTGIALDDQGFLYVTDRDLGQVFKFQVPED